jgi:formate dehydrogenase maturation protein FdhE
MNRRRFLEAAAAVSALPLSAPTADGSVDDSPTTRTCDVCGGEKPAEMVEQTTIKPLEPLEITACEICQHVQNHSLSDHQCMQCGADIDIGFGIELEYPLGPDDLPAFMSGQLCGECAGWIASDINYEGIDADEKANDHLCDLLDAQRARLRETGGY